MTPAQLSLPIPFSEVKAIAILRGWELEYSEYLSKYCCYLPKALCSIVGEENDTVFIYTTCNPHPIRGCSHRALVTYDLFNRIIERLDNEPR